MTHDLFETYRFHLLLKAEKPNQALAGPSIWLLCGHNRSAVEILDEDVANGSDAMVELLTRHDFDSFFEFLRTHKWLLFRHDSINNSLNIGHLPLHLISGKSSLSALLTKISSC